MKTGLLLAASLLLLSACGVTSKIGGLFGGDEEEDAIAPLVEMEPSIEVERLWSKRIGKGTDEYYLKLTPAADGQLVFATEIGGRVYALDVETGDVVWKQDVDRPVSGGVGLGIGAVYVGTSDGEVVALSQEDGEIQWTAAVSSEVLAAPRAAEGVVVVRSGDGKLFGLEEASGDRLWVYDRTEPVLTLRGTSAPLLIDILAIAGFDGGQLVALDIRTGGVVWEARVAIPRGRSDLERMVDIDSQPIAVGGVVYAATYQGRLAAISAQTGEIVWARDISSHAGISVDSEAVYVTDETSRLLALDRLTGNSLWSREELEGRRISALTNAGSYLVAGDAEGYLHFMESGDGRFAARVSVDDSPINVPVLVTNESVIAYSSDGLLAAYRPL